MKRWLAILVIFSVFQNETFATHAAGMDISYECVGSSGGGSGVSITITINTQAWGNEISWDITSGGVIYASGSGYNSYSSYTITACVPAGSLVFNMYDSWGDGWNGGTYSITGNTTLSGQTSGGLNTGSFGSNNFNVSGGTPCTISSSSAYKVTLSFYRDCTNGISAPSTFTLEVNPDNCSGVNGFSTTLNLISGPTVITPICPQAGNPCTNSNVVGIEEYVYTATITLPSQCSSWNLRVWECCRNNAINTIANPGGQELCVEATINNTNLCNNSPTFTQYPVPYICANTPFCYNNGAIDPDGDSLVYSLITPMNNGGSVNYNGGYSVNNPVGGLNTSFDPVSGNLCMIAPNQLTSVFAVMVSEYRNGVLIGSVIRDIQINVLTCTEPPPYLSGIDTLIQVDTSSILSTYEACIDIGDTVSFDVNGLTNSSVTNITMGWNNAIPNASFSVTNNGTPNPVGNFFWIPTAADTNSPYYIVIQLEDDACPLMGTFSFSYEIILETESDIEISSNISDVTCAGYNDGSIDITINGINTIPSFYWTDENGNFISSNEDLNNLDSGIYTVTVSATGECDQSESFYIGTASAMSFSSSITNIDCYGNANGAITPNLTGGSAPFTYSWSNGNSSQNLSNLGPGNYSLTVIDSNGCSLTDFYNIIEPPQLSAISNTSNVSCFGFNDGSISISILGGVADYTINAAGYSQVLTGGVSLFATPSLLSPSDYPYSVIDSNGCVFNDTVTVTQPNQLTVNESIQNVSCFGLADGMASLSISGGIPAYIENWGTANPFSLGGGIYNYTITDANGCIFNDSVEIFEPNLLTSSFTSTNVTTCSGTDGSIDVSVFGGSLPYQFTWNNGSTLEDLNNIAAGNYSLTITDNNGCLDSINTVITQPPTPLLTSVEVNASCFGLSDGGIDLTISSGTSPFNFSWSNGAISEDLINVPAGIYSVAVIDLNNCSTTASITISEPTEIMSIAATSNVKCNGGNDGSVNLILSGGVPPYVEDWGIFNSDSLTAGQYTCIVTDSINCTDTVTALISQPNPITTSPVTSDVSCNGGSNGTVSLNTAGGVAPYVEDWNGFSPSNLIIGNYFYTVTDFNNCIYTGNVTINQPESLIVNHSITDVSCNGWSNGSASLSITGGVAPYIEDWNGSNPDSLTSGTYNYTVLDDNGCTFTNQIVINEPPGLNVVVDTNRASCFGASDGTVSLVITGGAPPYIEDWGGQNINALSAGSYNFIITYNSSCTYQGQAIITEPNDIMVNETITNASCYGFGDGSISVQITGGTPPYNENWYGINIGALPKGNYNYTITDTNGCTKSDYITVNEPDTLEVTATVIDANCFNSNDGKILLTTNGGTPPYNENWYGNNPLALTAGNYNYTVVDENGCSFDSSAVVSQANEILISIANDSPICNGDSASIFIDITNPTSQFYNITISDLSESKQYLIDSNGVLFPSGIPISLSPNQSTQYVITYIEDASGCSSIPNDTTELIVNQIPVLDIGLDNICEADASFFLNQATPSGGDYFINGVANSFFDIEELGVGVYSIEYRYTDSLTGCFNSIKELINIHPNPVASFTFNPRVTDSLNSDVLFISTTESFYDLEWFSNDQKISDTSEFWYSFSNVGKYEIKLVAKNSLNCTDTISDSLIINPIFSAFIPNSFTPGNDNNNEKFGPILNAYKRYNMIIYNRWGGAIYRSENQYWDGKINNQLAPSGVYSYFIEVVDFKDKTYEYTGLLYLLR